jgi:hypothetical protein
MSFIDDIVDLGSTAFKWMGGSGVGPSIARTALTGYALTKISSALKSNEKDDKSYKRITLDPDMENRIPVVYGKAAVPGIVIDAELTNSNKTMYYVVVLSEKTGNVTLGAGAASSFTFNSIYRDDCKLVFDTDGITVTKWIDRDGNEDTSPNGLIRVWCFNGNSQTPVVPTGYTNASLANAYAVMPGWTSTYMMNDLIFAIVRIDYNKEDKDITELGDFKFVLENSMTLPGDCMYDYMTNTRYGAGIDPAEINVS